MPTKSTKVTKKNIMLRVNTPLDAKTEAIVEAVIGCGLAVHRELGPGFVETIYRRAMCLELDMLAIPFECEKSIAFGTGDIRFQVNDSICLSLGVWWLKSRPRHASSRSKRRN